LVRTYFQEYVYAFSVLKAVLEPNNIRVIERLVNLDFGGELNGMRGTFSFALDRLSDDFSIIFAA